MSSAHSNSPSEARLPLGRLRGGGGISRRLLQSNLGAEAQEVPNQTATALRFSMETLQFAIREDWQIVSFSKEAKEQFFESLDSDQGEGARSLNLRALLIQTEPAWAKMLQHEVCAVLKADRIFLPWDVERQRLGMGWSIYCLECGPALYSVTLVPVMCPGGQATLAEHSLSLDGAHLQEGLRELFLRTQQQESRFQYFVRHLPGAHFKQDPQCRFTLINSDLEELMGGQSVRDLAAGSEWLDWIHPSDRAEVSANLARCHEANLPTSCRFRLLLPDGDRVLHLMELRIPVRGIDGRLGGFEGLWLDLTREELAQEQLQHSAWKDSLAQISGSLSHDFNNLLAGLVSLSELLLMDLEESDELYQTASLIKSTTDQATELSGRIIALNREERGRPGLQDLSALVSEQIDLLKILLPQNVTLELQGADEEYPVRVDPVSMRRILVNFAVNARDVLDRKGQVTLKMRTVDLAAYDASCLVSSECERSGPGVEFVFQDDGPGIPPEIVGRIFGAYFSTKDGTTSSGSGLGLYCLTQFARDNHFDYGVRTQVGEGTEMVLLFPLVDDVSDADLGVDDDTDLAVCFERPPVALYGSANAATNAVVAGLCRRGVEVETFDAISDLQSWLAACGDEPRTVLIAFAYHDQSKVRATCEALELRSAHLQSILSLQGLNPVHFSDLIGAPFDQLLMSNAQPSDCVNAIIAHLSAVSQ